MTDVRQPSQFGVGQTLPMFVQARDLKGMKVNPEDLQAGEKDQDLWDRKLGEAQMTEDRGLISWDPEEEGRSLYASIRDEGVKQPVHVHHDVKRSEVWDGYHRTASANSVSPDTEVPVYHSDPASYDAHISRVLAGMQKDARAL